MDTARRCVWLLVVLALVSSPVPALGAGGIGNCRPIPAPLPAVITEEGVWCLTSNLGTAMLRGIAVWIKADNVVLDLNGFILEGLADRETTTAMGVFAGGQQNVTIRNGTIRGFYYGTSLVGANITVEGIRADRNTFTGIGVTGAGTLIRDNKVIATGGTGISIPGVAPAVGIQVSGPAPRVLNNDVTGIPNEASAKATGIFLIGLGGVVVNNRIVFMDRGIEFGGFVASDGKYRDNVTFDVVTPYIGGRDAGNNH